MRFFVVLLSVVFTFQAYAQSAMPEIQDKKKRVLVAFMPDRDVSFWRDGIPLRINRTIFPVEDTTARIELPGMDMAKMVLDNFASAFSAAYPDITFVPVYELSEKLAPPASNRPGYIGSRSERAAAILKPQMVSSNTGSVLLIAASNDGDSDRPNPYGAFGVFTTGVRDGEATRAFKRWRALIRWQVTVVALDINLSFKDSSTAWASTAGTDYTSGKREDFNMLPWFEGTESEISQMISATRRSEILDTTEKLVSTASKGAIRSFAAAMERSRDRSPHYWNLPYLPAIDPQNRSGDRSQ